MPGGGMIRAADFPLRCAHGPSVRANAAGPSEFAEVLLGNEKFAVSRIEDVEEPVAISMEKELPLLSAERSIGDHVGNVGVPIPQIMRRELVVPLQLAVRRIQR